MHVFSIAYLNMIEIPIAIFCVLKGSLCPVYSKVSETVATVIIQ